jgi:hypothetical protein
LSNSAEDRATQECDPSADGAADTLEVCSTSDPPKCLPQSDKSWGRRGKAPGIHFKVDLRLTKGGESPPGAQVQSNRWNSRRRGGSVQTVFVPPPAAFPLQAGRRQHQQGDVMVPARPTAACEVVQPPFFFPLLVVLFDPVPTLGHPQQAAPAAAPGQIT